MTNPQKRQYKRTLRNITDFAVACLMSILIFSVLAVIAVNVYQ